MFQKVKENISIITILIIIVGYYDMYTYYQKFGINIYNYLEPTEIIFAFSSIFQASIKILTTILIGVVFTIVTIREKKMSATEMSSQLIRNELKQQLKNGWLLVGVLVLVLGCVIVLNLLFKTSLTITEEDLVILYSFICVDSFMLTKILILNKKIKMINGAGITDEKIERVEKSHYNVVCCFIFLVVITFFNHRNSIKYGNVLSGNPKYSVQISPTPIDFSLNSQYVGSTKSYVFFYDNALIKVKAYPERNIDLVSIKELRNGL